MYQTLLTRLTSLQTNYNEALKVVNKIFDCLADNDIKALPSHTNSQLEFMTLIKTEKEQLRNDVKKIAEKYDVHSSEYKLKEILFIFNQNQKEQLLDISRNIHRLEIEVQRALYRNQDFLSSIISASEAIVDSASEYSENEYNESQLFLDEKF